MQGRKSKNMKLTKMISDNFRPYAMWEIPASKAKSRWESRSRARMTKMTLVILYLRNQMLTHRLMLHLLVKSPQRQLARNTSHPNRKRMSLMMMQTSANSRARRPYRIEQILKRKRSPAKGMSKSQALSITLQMISQLCPSISVWASQPRVPMDQHRCKDLPSTRKSSKL